MLRIFTELMPPERLAEPATRRLLSRFGVQPLVALPPERETPAMADALARLSGAGPIGLWPLLEDTEGYWPSDGNVQAFSARVDAALAFARRAGAQVRTVVVDLEPPLEVTHALFDDGPVGAMVTLSGRVRRAWRVDERRRREQARADFVAFGARLEALGLESFATVLPNVLLDAPGGRGIWQALLETQALAPRWGRVCPMLYTSVFRSMLPSGRAASARALAFELARRARIRCGPRAAAALGLAGRGKLGSEPVLPSPEALAADVAVVRAAGLDDLALFSLEGVLDRDAPEAWLAAFAEARAAPPAGLLPWAWRLGLSLSGVPSHLGRILPEHV